MTAGIDKNDPSPLYTQIERDIKRKIKDRILSTGDSVGSHAELSKEYGVSLITVKKALANLIADGVLYSRVGKGTYVADAGDKKLDLDRHKAIGLVLRDLKHPYFSLIMHGIEARAYELGYNILLSSSSNSAEREEQQINNFLELGVDGLIIASLSLQYRATEQIQRIHEDNFPYVMVSYIHDPEYWYVGSNHEVGGFLATEHLIKTGFKTIGYVHPGKGNLLSDVRKNGYSQALAEYNIPYDSQFIYHASQEGADRTKLGYEFGKEFLRLEKKPEALYFYNDALALGFEQAVLEGGMRVPDDIAIVGNDDIPLAAYSSTPLTTIHQSAEEVGTKAVDVIHRRLTGRDVDNRTILKPTLIVRDSCGARKRSGPRMVVGAND